MSVVSAFGNDAFSLCGAGDGFGIPLFLGIAVDNGIVGLASGRGAFRNAVVLASGEVRAGIYGMLVGFASAGDTCAEFGIAFMVSETLTVFAFWAAVVFIVQTDDNSVGICGFALIILTIAFCAYAIITEFSSLAGISAAAAMIEIVHQIDAFRMERIGFVAIGVACITGKRAFVISAIGHLAVTAV